jgi:hypothetical protein
VGRGEYDAHRKSIVPGHQTAGEIPRLPKEFGGPAGRGKLGMTTFRVRQSRAREREGQIPTAADRDKPKRLGLQPRSRSLVVHPYGGIRANLLGMTASDVIAKAA